MGKMIRNELNKLVKEEKGQAFILVLILLLVGGLIIAPLLGFMSTGLLAGQMHEEKMEGLYAADAGVEDALWKIKNDPPATYPDSYQLPADVNEMSVSVVIEEVTVFYGEELGSGVHYWIVKLESELMEPSDPNYLGDYTYRLNLTNKHNKNVGVERVMVTFSTDLDYPVEYQVDGLYDEDVDGLAKGSFSNGALTVTESGDNQILTWEFPGGDTKIIGADDPDDPSTWVTVTCIFQLVGFGDAPIISNFVFVGASEDIGAVWEYKPFGITATAQAEDGSTVVIKARALDIADMVFVSYWQID